DRSVHRRFLPRPGPSRGGDRPGPRSRGVPRESNRHRCEAIPPSGGSPRRAEARHNQNQDRPGQANDAPASPSGRGQAILGPMGPYTLSLEEVDGTRLPDVGGKGANLGELTRAGFPVPAGFCVTTAAYRDFVRASGELAALLDALDRV